jgi:hypothetical protein
MSFSNDKCRLLAPRHQHTNPGCCSAVTCRRRIRDVLLDPAVK